jgi:hypothetical protein
MHSRLTKLGAALAVLAVLAVGGATLASASGGGGNSPAKAPAALKQQAPPAADSEVNGSGNAADTDNIQDQSGADAIGQADSESAGSETPGNDGPGGHADEPGNPNADTPQQGEN